ncbi:MAG TPA: acyl-CoA dehydrogenase family protein [Acidimicrobiales bacterium]|nr:acyl-CoA dehydrogenase family protein [Acidimicrobiales bacterium]
MDLEHSLDQDALAGVVRAIVAGRFSMERIRRREGTPLVVDPDDWAALGEAGVFSLTVAEDEGGVGLGMADAAVVFEELGRGLVPGPLVASHLAAGLTDSPLFAGAADGTTVVGAVTRPRMSDTGARVPLIVEHLASLDAMIVVGHDGLLSVLSTDDLEAEPIAHPLDPLTPLSVLTSLPEGDPVGDRDTAIRFTQGTHILTGALCAGMAAATCSMAVDYAKERQQFGRPIGSFQAVKHLCADMLVRAEVARAAVDVAAVTADQPDTGDTVRAAAGAALLAAEAAIANAKTSIQVHGGMGFTWEVPVHLYLMRARVLASSLGPLGALARTVAARY